MNIKTLQFIKGLKIKFQIKSIDNGHQSSKMLFYTTSTQASCYETVEKLDNAQYINESRFNKLERELLRNELIVTGVPAVHGESMFDIIGDIVNALQSNISSSDVVASYRLPLRKNTSGKLHNDRLSAPIVLKLGSDGAKQELLSRYFKMKNLNTGDIGYQSKARIYINESLTIHNRAIFKAASQAKKSKLISKCYTRNGIVHIQACEEGKIFRINDLDYLNAIISHRPSIPKPNQATSNTSMNHNPNSNGSSANSNQLQQPPTPATIETGGSTNTKTSTKPDWSDTMQDGEQRSGQ